VCVCVREREALLASKTSVLTTMHTTVRCIHSAVSRPHPLLCGHRVHTTTPCGGGGVGVGGWEDWSVKVERFKAGSYAW